MSSTENMENHPKHSTEEQLATIVSLYKSVKDCSSSRIAGFAKLFKIKQFEDGGAKEVCTRTWISLWDTKDHLMECTRYSAASEG